MVDPSSNLQGTSLTLIERARAHDEGAWTRIVLLYTPLVRKWCFRSGLQENDADDVVQEVFRAALAGLDDFHRDRPGDSFRGWLRVITRNSLALHFRKKGRAPAASGGSEAFSNFWKSPILTSISPTTIPPRSFKSCTAGPSSWSGRSLRIEPGRCSG